MYLVIDLDEEIVRFSTAGHHAPLLQRKHRAQPRQLFEPGEFSGPALLMLEDSHYRLGECELHHGDRLFLFTDGLTELPLKTQPTDEVGVEYICRFLESQPDHELQSLPKAMMHASLACAGKKKFTDDVCVVGIELNGSNS